MLERIQARAAARLYELTGHALTDSPSGEQRPSRGQRRVENGHSRTTSPRQQDPLWLKHRDTNV